MIDYWKDLPSSIKGSKVKRFNYIMNKINNTYDDDDGEGESGGEQSDSSQNPSSPLEHYNISFSIKDEDGRSVSGAKVTVDCITKTTGSAGGCTFPDIEEGTKTITVVADGFEEHAETINVNADNTSFNITITAG